MLQIPALVLNDGDTYIFQAIIENFLGSANQEQAIHQLTVSNAPKISIAAPGSVTVRAYNQLSIYAQVREH